jgi:hypothetical protein
MSFYIGMLASLQSPKPLIGSGPGPALSDYGDESVDPVRRAIRSRWAGQLDLEIFAGECGESSLRFAVISHLRYAVKIGLGPGATAWK